MGCKPLGLAQHQRGNPLLRRGFLPSPTQRPGLGTRDRVQVTGCRVHGTALLLVSLCCGIAGNPRLVPAESTAAQPMKTLSLEQK